MMADDHDGRHDGHDAYADDDAQSLLNLTIASALRWLGA